jgi:L-idonate 5-dehydrogenase
MSPPRDTMLAGVLHAAKDLRMEQVALPELRAGMVLLRVRRAGICGSDLHYFEHGYCGAFVPSRPFILGHEFTADVAAVAADVTAPEAGARVTVNPARACGFCDYCKAGRGNLCRQTVMLGSGSTTPPTDGAFAEWVMVRADQCHILPPQLDDGVGAMMEPLAVALHAVKQAGAVAGKRVLVIGGGPIGLLVMLTARAFGATPVALSDLVEGRRHAALKLGADVALDAAAKHLPERVCELTGDGFDVVFEASGAAPALRQAFNFVRRGATIVQIGTVGTDDVPLPVNQLMVGETRFIGSFRYGNVFDEAIRLVAGGRVNLEPLISEVFSLVELPQAMHRASAKGDVIKVQIQVS